MYINHIIMEITVANWKKIKFPPHLYFDSQFRFTIFKEIYIPVCLTSIQFYPIPIQLKNITYPKGQFSLNSPPRPNIQLQVTIQIKNNQQTGVLDVRDNNECVFCHDTKNKCASGIFRSAWWGGGLFGSFLKGGPSCLWVGDDYVNLAKIHRQWWLFVRICFVIKKLISSDSISVSVFLLTSIVCYVSCVNTELIFFIKQHHVQSGRLIYPNMPNSVFSGGWCKMMWTLVDLFSLKLKTLDSRSWIFWCLRLLLNTKNNVMVHTLYGHALCVQSTLFEVE